MGSRERKRAERRKRKRRASERHEPSDATPQAEGASEPSRSELKDRAAREALEPLREGERPGVVTVGAVITTLMAIIFWGSAVVTTVTDVEVRGSDFIPLVLFASILTLMAYGMWRARYWAVLGFQALLALVLVSAGLGLVAVTTVPQAVGTGVLFIGAGTLFYFMVKAMARIQMPQRRPRE